MAEGVIRAVLQFNFVHRFNSWHKCLSIQGDNMHCFRRLWQRWEKIKLHYNYAFNSTLCITFDYKQENSFRLGMLKFKFWTHTISFQDNQSHGASPTMKQHWWLSFSSTRSSVGLLKQSLLSWWVMMVSQYLCLCYQVVLHMPMDSFQMMCSTQQPGQCMEML